jgi:hypothetical protein
MVLLFVRVSKSGESGPGVAKNFHPGAVIVDLWVPVFTDAVVRNRLQVVGLINDGLFISLLQVVFRAEVVAVDVAYRIALPGYLVVQPAFDDEWVVGRLKIICKRDTRMKTRGFCLSELQR